MSNPAIALDQVNCLALGYWRPLKLNSGPGRKCVPVGLVTRMAQGTWQFSDFLVCMENQPRQPWPLQTCQMLEYPDWLSRPPKLYG